MPKKTVHFNCMKKHLLAASLLAITVAPSEAQRPARPEVITPPPPNNSGPATLLRNQQEAAVQVMSNRLNLLNGVFFSKYATTAQ
jgi:hypothetical protein